MTDLDEEPSSSVDIPLPLIAVHHEQVTNVKRPLVYHCPPACWLAVVFGLVMK